MTMFDADHMEFSTNSGHITIVSDSGEQVPAYWAHPQLGGRFSGIVLMHDWWGVTEEIRLLSNFFAQVGYYVIVPDLFNGQVASTPKQAMKLFDANEATAYERVDAALRALESHNQCNRKVAAVGVGMGGSLAFEAAIKRDDLEAAIAYSGFPQRYIKDFDKANTSILAFFGSEEPYTKPVVIKALEKALTTSPLKDSHEVKVMQGIGHDFFSPKLKFGERQVARKAIDHSLNFLERHIGRLRGGDYSEII